MKNIQASPKSFVTQNDWFLEMLIYMVQGTDERIPCTLLIDGLILSGDLVGGNKYFEEVLELHFQQIDGLDYPNREIIKETVADYNNKENLPFSSLGYFHMLDAKFYPANGSGIPTGGTEFRGKIDRVSGFHIGTYVMPDEEIPDSEPDSDLEFQANTLQKTIEPSKS